MGANQPASSTPTEFGEPDLPDLLLLEDAGAVQHCRAYESCLVDR
jgi:hypothetical protein